MMAASRPCAQQGSRPDGPAFRRGRETRAEQVGTPAPNNSRLSSGFRQFSHVAYCNGTTFTMQTTRRPRATFMAIVRAT